MTAASKRLGGLNGLWSVLSGQCGQSPHEPGPGWIGQARARVVPRKVRVVKMTDLAGDRSIFT